MKIDIDPEDVKKLVFTFSNYTNCVVECNVENIDTVVRMNASVYAMCKDYSLDRLSEVIENNASSASAKAASRVIFKLASGRSNVRIQCSNTLDLAYFIYIAAIQHDESNAHHDRLVKITSSLRAAFGTEKEKEKDKQGASAGSLNNVDLRFNLISSLNAFLSINVRKTILKNIHTRLFTPSVTCIPMSLEDLQKIVWFEDCLGPSHEANKLIERTYSEMLTKFYDVRKIFSDMTSPKFDIANNTAYHFCNMPEKGVEKWLKSPYLQVDSENSVWYMFVSWTRAKKWNTYIPTINRSVEFNKLPSCPFTVSGDVIERLARCINYQAMRKEFLMDVVNDFISALKDASRDNVSYGAACEAISDFKRHALREILVSGSTVFRRSECSRLYSSVKRSYLNDIKEVSFRCLFSDISKWSKTQKYYSSPVLIHGYEFYYFLQCMHPSGTRNTDTIGGFVRCSISIMINEKYVHYLPMHYNISIQKDRWVEGEPPMRNFSTLKVVFEHDDKAIGGPINVQNETWDDIVSGRSDRKSVV